MNSTERSAFEFEEKLRDGSKTLVRLTELEFMRLVQENAWLVASRLAIVNCQICGRRFPVNRQDFRQVSRCIKGFGCMA